MGAIGLVPADYLHVVSPGEDPAAFLDLDPEYEAIEDSRVQARRDAYGSLTKGDCLRVTTAFNPEFAPSSLSWQVTSSRSWEPNRPSGSTPSGSPPPFHPGEAPTPAPKRV